MKKKTQFLKKFAHILFRTFETCVAFIVVIFSLALYLLHDSPMDAQFLMQEVEKIILPKESEFHLTTESVILGSDLQKEGLLQLEISNLKVLRPDDSVVLSVPEVRLAYDFWHLLTLNYVPSTVLLKKPYVNMNLSDSGALTVGENNPKSFLDENKIKRIVRHVLSFKHIDIQGAKIDIHENALKEKFAFQDLNLNLSRHFRIHEKIHFSSQLTYAGQTTKILMDGSMNKFNKNLNLELGIPSIYLKPLGRFIPLLEGMDFPVQVSLKGRINLSKLKYSLPEGIHKLNFQVKSVKGGTLNLPAPLTNIYPLKEIEINGLLTKNCELLKMASSFMVLQSGTRASLNASITGLNQFLKTGNLQEIKTDFSSQVQNITTENIPNVWPSAIGYSTHEWVKNHLSKGKIDHADFYLYFKGDELVDLYGDVYAQGVRVDYLPPMPPVQDVWARIELYPDTVKIQTEKGYVDSLQIAGTKLLFTDVDIDPSWAKVDLKATGLVKDVFKLLSSKPLEFTQEYGINVQKSSGKATLDTELFFKLDTESEPDEVKVKTKAKISDAKIVFENPLFALDNGTLDLDLNNDQMHVKGQAEVLEMPLSIDWLEYFTPKNNLLSTYQASGTFSTNYLKDLYPNIEKFVSGNLTLTASAKKYSDTRGLNGKLEIDATKSLVHFYPLGLDKKWGYPLQMSADFSKNSGNDLRASFEASGDILNPKDLSIQGKIQLGKEIKLDFPVIQAPQTSTQFFFHKNNVDFSLKVKGKTWNAPQIFTMPTDFIEAKMLQDKHTRNVLLDIQMDQVIFDPKHPIKNLSITGKRQQKNWTSFHAQADLKQPFILVFDESEKQFKGAYQDLGNLMDSLGFKTSISEGGIVLVADQKDSGEIKGKAYIQSLKLKDPGFMTQALTLLGIIDAFMGKDIVFDEIEVPFLLNLKNQLYIHDSHASGTNLGITLKGEIFANELNLQGSLVPAYAINSLPGKIPVVGWLFKNAEGGGLINVPFTVHGTIGKPEVDFSLLKTMTPGFLGGLF